MFGLNQATMIVIGIMALMIVGEGVALKISHSDYLAAKAEKQLAEGQRDEFKRVADRNAQTIREVTAARDQFRSDAESARADLSTQRKAAVTQVNRLKKEIADATTQNECPVAPSVVSALRGLSGTDAGPNGDRGAGDAPAGSGRADGAVRGPSAGS